MKNFEMTSSTWFALAVGLVLGYVVALFVPGILVTELGPSTSPSIEWVSEAEVTEAEKTLVHNLALDPWLLFEKGHGRTYDQIVVTVIGTDLPNYNISMYVDGEKVKSSGPTLSAHNLGLSQYEPWYHVCFQLDCEGEIPEEFAAQYPELVVMSKAVGRRSQ
jgi:hypothetical protein